MRTSGSPMADASVLKDAFSRLQPVCVELAQSQTVENLERLLNVLSTLDQHVVRDLHEYILFPLRVTLKKIGVRSEKQAILCLTCVKRILLHCDSSVVHINLYQDMFSTLCCLISNPPSTTSDSLTVADVCEELKLEVVYCLQQLAKCASSSVAEQFYVEDSIPVLGHAVSVLLEIVKFESLRVLRKTAIQCLVGLMHCDRSDSLHKTCAEIYAAFLPGIISGLSGVITADSKQGHLVTCAAISAWHQTVTLMLSDMSLDQMPAPVSDGNFSELNSVKENKISQSSTAPSRSSLLVRRTVQWVESTAEKILLLTNKIAPVATDSHWKVRLAMVELAGDVLMNCTKSLKCCTVPLIDILVRATTDDYSSSVAARSRQLLSDFSELRLRSGSRSLIETLEENIYILATRLPTSLMAGDDGAKLSSVRLLRGYIELLGSHISVVINSTVHLERLSTALVNILQFDCSIIQIIEERTTGDPSSNINLVETIDPTRYSFRYFIDRNIESEIMRICQLLGYYGNLAMLVDHFMEIFVRTAVNRKQAAYCVNEILSGACQPPFQTMAGTDCWLNTQMEEMQSVVRLLLDEYLQAKYWNLPVTGRLKTKDVEPFLVGSEVFLIDILYQLLEKVGSDSARVSRCALTCLGGVAVSCGAGTVAKLIQENADYLVNSVSLKLRHIERFPEAPMVLRVALTHGDIAVLPLVNDLILEILRTLDDNQEHAISFVGVLQALVTSVVVHNRAKSAGEKDHKSNQLDSVNNCPVAKRQPSAMEIQRYFDDYRQQKAAANKIDDDVDKVGHDGASLNSADLEADDEEIKSDDLEDEKKDIPDHIKLVIEILSRCEHLLTSADAKLRLAVLECVSSSCVAMIPYKGELLPLVHRIWKPFVNRLCDEEPVVAVKAFDTFNIMAGVCGDFMHRRFVDDVVPKMTASLSKLAPRSVGVGPSYQYTQTCKLQLCLLRNLGPLCRHADVTGLKLGGLMNASLPYLSGRQPLCLQQACSQTFRDFIAIDADSVWLLLNDIYCPQSPLVSTVDCLPKIRMAGSGTRNEFTDNVTELLGLL